MTGEPHPWPHLEAPLLAILRANPDGLSEFDLIRRLQRDYDLPEFPPDALGDPVSLYRTHFALFHTLHRLSDSLPEGQVVEVGCLRCRLREASGGAVDPDTAGALGAADPMRAYYLDLANLDLDRAQVKRMLDGFWQLFAGGDRRREEALAVLGLADPVSDGEIKAAYRRLAMTHHPDRGGDTRELQALNEAIAVLGV